MNNTLQQLLSDLSLYHPLDHNTLLRQQLEAHITTLIQKDFTQLVDLLYRIDINEKKLKTLLATQPGTDSAALIAQLIIDRQLEKKALRQAYKPDNDIPEEERW